MKTYDEDKKIIKNDFKLLAEKGNLGFYNSYEITTIFLIDNEIKKARNFYTIIVSEEKKFNSKEKDKNVTEKLININKKYSLGIKKYRRDINELEEIFNKLLEENKWGYGKSSLIIGELKPLPKQFISGDEDNEVPINSVLKNNFYNGSYILEFFDQEKQELEEVLESDMLLEKICKNIRKLLPVDLLYIRDRIGNIVFQFPSTILTVNTRSLRQWEGIEANIAWHPLFKNIENIAIQARSELDKNIMGFYQVDEINQANNKLYTGSSKNENNIIFYNKENKLILKILSGTYIGEINFSLNVSQAYQESRTLNFFNEEKKLIKTIDIPVVYNSNNRKIEKKDYSYWISNRIYENEKKRLEKNLIFIQYGRKTNDREKALKDLRCLINNYGKDGIYLWDPYLSHKDILNTLYYNRISGVPMKAINSYSKLKNLKSEESEYKKWVKSQRENFENGSNNLGINLELRSQQNQYGWGFHDRFIIFPFKNGRPRVWSLGTSINSLGKEHHILQEVSNAKMILDAFIDLWEELNHPECLVWRS